MKNKKSIISILIVIMAVLITCFAISVFAENTGGTAEQREDEKTLVRLAAHLSMGTTTGNKVDITKLGENLDKYIGEGNTTTAQTDDVITVTFVSTGNTYDVNVNSGPMFSGDEGAEGVVLPSTIETTPYLPTGFVPVAGTDLSNGLTIQDGAGNQYVWVEVPRTTTVYDEAGLDLDLANLTGTDLTNAYTAIEDDLHDYTTDYRNGTSFKDIHSGNDASTGLTSTQYTELKQKMLKSVYQNGGFYVGKYEAGITNSYRDYGDDYETEHPVTETAVVQANAYPYNWVRCSQAQSLASGMASGEYTSSLMFGVQWDLMLKYIETKGAATQDQLNEDSTSWGNVRNNTYDITNTSAKYNVVDTNTYLITEWLDAPYSKIEEGYTILTTGASEAFSKMGIHNIAGNMTEWTLEYTSDSSFPCVYRGSGFCFSGDSWNYPASGREGNSNTATSSYPWKGFRPSIF